jgi:D-tyrosyl-tRNA(Tyr) deacylase
MIALLQRVSEATVIVNGNMVGEISNGILALIGVEKNDTEKQAERLLQRLLAYRIFPDDADRMNLNLGQSGGRLLLVPQFTLAADTRRGNRPSFTPAAPPIEGERLFNFLAALAEQELEDVQSGVFGADMKVHLVNDGPVTFWLQVPPTT